MHERGPDGPHLGAEQVAAYAEGRLPHEHRGEVEAHLAECASCRREVTEVVRFMQREARKGRPWKLAIPLAAAAAVVLAAVFALPERDEMGGDPVFRNGPEAASEDVPALEIVSPGEGAPTGEDPLVFSWRSAGRDAMYRLVLADETGDPIWERSTADTSLALPGDVRLEPGRPYFWYVDALMADGRSATSGVRELRRMP